LARPLYAKEKVIVDNVAVLGIVLSILLFLYGSTFADQNPAAAEKSLLAFSLGLGGLVMMMLMIGVEYDRHLSWAELNQSVYLVGLALFAVVMINAVTFKFVKLEVAPMPRSMFAVLIGISETLLFIGFLQSWITAVTGQPLLGVLASNVVFATFHAAVYGLNTPALLVVGASGVMLSVTFMLTRRLSIPILAHAIINLLAFLGGG
jgi:membrane protease YdiL (CAAX protease family)